MTLAIGVCCDDGVVLGVDGQLSVENSKLTTQKISWFFPVSNYQLVFAAQGHEDPSRLAIDLIRRELSGLADKTLTVAEITGYISSCLTMIYSTYVDSAPAEDRFSLNFSLLVAIRQGMAVQLFRTNRDMVVPIRSRPHPWWCLGVGTDLANYLLELLLNPYSSVEVAAQVVAYIISVVEKSVEGVGKGSDVHIIEKDGTHWSLSAPDLRQVENDFVECFKELRNSMSFLDTNATSDGGAELHFSFLRERLFALRASHRKRSELRLRQLREMRERR